MGVESHILSPEESKKLYPLMNIDDVVGTLYSPTDGHIDPAGYCTALTRAAKKNGAQVRLPTVSRIMFYVLSFLYISLIRVNCIQIITNCEATEIETYVDDFGRKKVKAVKTDKGRIETDNVLVCGGELTYACSIPYLKQCLIQPLFIIMYSNLSQF